jgi:hypothetical protein
MHLQFAFLHWEGHGLQQLLKKARTGGSAPEARQILAPGVSPGLEKKDPEPRRGDRNVESEIDSFLSPLPHPSASERTEDPGPGLAQLSHSDPRLTPWSRSAESFAPFGGFFQ